MRLIPGRDKGCCITVDPNAAYAAVRRSLTDLDERVAARYWDEQAPVRVSYRRLLSSLDQLAGLLLGEPAKPQPIPSEPAALETGTEPEPAALEAGTEPQPTPTGPAAPEPAAEPEPRDNAAALVEIGFALPAEVQADSVVLSGDFNQWSRDGIQLERDTDGTWRATVALEPGRSYRFRYLLDGERWENAWDADQYVPNSFGGTDSVIIVEPSPSR
jgi:Glycogen recognition site of AMP-activated protein kinase